jgi:formylmethanofuran dehydrogenase subunit E
MQEKSIIKASDIMRLREIMQPKPKCEICNEETMRLVIFADLSRRILCASCFKRPEDINAPAK